jgi:hypothetical protein
MERRQRKAVLGIKKLYAAVPANHFTHLQTYFHERVLAVKPVSGITEEVISAYDFADLVAQVIKRKMDGTLLQEIKDLGSAHTQLDVPVAFGDLCSRQRATGCECQAQAYQNG